MKTAILNQPGTLVIEDRPAPEYPGPGEAIVRVHRVGLCGTDLHAYQGKQPFLTYPRVLGHELGGEVVSVARDIKGLAPGDPCAIEPYLHCGSCIACRRGKTNCCANLNVLGVHSDGGLRELITVPANKLHKAEKLTFEQLALVETLSIGAHAVSRARIEAEELVLVVGVGPIGLSIVQAANAAGARIIVLDVRRHRLDFCKAQLAVEHTLLASGSSVEEVRSITNGEMPTAVFDATGNLPSMQASFDYVAHGGRLVFVGIVQDDVRFYDPDFHRREITLLSSRNSIANDFKQTISLMQSGRINIARWITHRSRLERLPDQLANWVKPEAGVIKAMVEI